MRCLSSRRARVLLFLWYKRGGGVDDDGDGGGGDDGVGWVVSLWRMKNIIQIAVHPRAYSSRSHTHTHAQKQKQIVESAARKNRLQLWKCAAPCTHKKNLLPSFRWHSFFFIFYNFHHTQFDLNILWVRGKWNRARTTEISSIILSEWKTEKKN